MSKSIKLKNDIYIDSAGVVHNQELLSNILENMKAVTLYDNSNGTSDATVELAEDISAYRYIEAWVGLYSKKCIRMLVTNGSCAGSAIDSTWSDTVYFRICRLSIENKVVTKTEDRLVYIYDSPGQRNGSSKLYKIIGYK